MKIEFDESQLDYLLRVLNNNYADTAADFNADITGQSPSDLLVGKIITQYRDGYDAYDSARKSRYLKEKLNKFLFMGNGNQSLSLLNDLHRRLNFAASESSGRQQNGGMGTEYEKAYEVAAKKNIIDVIKDMMVAFNISSTDLKMNCRSCDLNLAIHGMTSEHTLVDVNIYCPLCEKNTISIYHPEDNNMWSGESYECHNCNNYILYVEDNKIWKDEFYSSEFYILRDHENIQFNSYDLNEDTETTIMYLPPNFEFNSSVFDRCKKLIVLS